MNKPALFRSMLILLLLSAFSISFPSVKSYSAVDSRAAYNIAKKDFEKGLVFYNRMQYLASIEFFRKAVSAYPDYYLARDYLARAYRLAGFTDAALREWGVLHEIAPGNAATAHRIETLRYLLSRPGKDTDYSRLVLYSSYKSSDFKRFSFNNPVDMAIDNDKSVYITSFSSGKLVKIDSNGRGVFTLRPGFRSRLYGIDFHGNRIAVSDFSLDTVYIMDRKGKIIHRIGSSGSGKGKFHGPEGVCFDNRGRIFVVDSGNHRIQKFSPAGSHILGFGKKGGYEGDLSNPTDVVFLDSRVYVTDTGNSRIACFDDSGNFIKNFPYPGMSSPRGISTDGKKLLISDEKKGLLLYDPKEESGTWFSTWGKDRKSFSRLTSADTDRNGYVYCLDYNRSEMYLFSPVQTRYSNLVVDIMSVDTERFPVMAVYLTVRTRDGRPVNALDQDNFKITEDNAAITNFSTDYLQKKDPSASFVLCVDRSPATSGFHNDIPWLADFILKKMKKNDSIRIINYSGNTWEGSGFDWSRRRAIRALRKRKYGRGKNTGKALYNGISDLVPRTNRRGLVLITDGSVAPDSFSVYTADTVIEYARAHLIPVYIISLKKPDPVLTRIAAETGGALMRANQLSGLRKIYDSVRKKTEYRYVLVYSTFKPANFRGWWSDLKIEVNHKGQKGLEKAGYFVP